MSFENADAYDVDVPVARKPQPVTEPGWRCVSCDRTVEPTWWGRTTGWDLKPLCGSCEQRWGKALPGNIRTGVTRGDRRAYQRLSAMVARLDWEVMNGGGRWERRVRLNHV